MLSDRNIEIENVGHYGLVENKLKLMALNMFKWSNLPNGLKSENIEKALYYHGQAIMFEHEDLGLVMLASSNNGQVNIYGEPITVNATGFNENKIVSVENGLDRHRYLEIEYTKGILCKNNDLMLPTHSFVKDYAKKMYEVERAININVKQQKFPFMIATNTKKLLSDKELMRKFENGDMAIFHSQDYDLSKMQSLNFNVPYVVDKLQTYKQQLEQEILTFFGDNNTNTSKKERMVVDEVNANNEYILKMLDIFHKTRLQFVEEVNNYYGLDIKVDITNRLIKEELDKLYSYDDEVIDNVENIGS